MYYEKVSSMKIGQYGYDTDSKRHFVRCGFSRANNAYKMYDVLNDVYVLMDGVELLAVIKG